MPPQIRLPFEKEIYAMEDLLAKLEAEVRLKRVQHGRWAKQGEPRATGAIPFRFKVRQGTIDLHVMANDADLERALGVEGFAAISEIVRRGPGELHLAVSKVKLILTPSGRKRPSTITVSSRDAAILFGEDWRDEGAWDRIMKRIQERKGDLPPGGA